MLQYDDWIDLVGQILILSVPLGLLVWVIVTAIQRGEPGAPRRRLSPGENARRFAQRNSGHGGPPPGPV